MANPVIKKFIQKQLFKQKGTISSGKAVDFSTNALETRLTNAGIDLNLIKSQRDLDQALAFVKQIEDQVFAKKFGETFGKKESAKVFDLEGKRLDPDKPIMGGTQDEKDILQKSIDKNIKTATEKGDFKGIANQVLRDPDIAREFMLSKKFPFRRDINVRSGEDAIPLARAAKFDEEMKKLNISATPGKDAENTVGEFVDQMKKFGVKDKDIQMMLGSGKSGQIPYVMEQYGLSASDVVNILKRGDDLIEGLAKGGRAGFKVGSPSKRAFLKVMGGLAATITALKSGLIGAPKKEVAKQVVKESVKDVANAPPQYFFDLAQTIKKFGKPDKVTYSDRVEIHRMVSKDGKSELQLTEDLTTGDIQIKKIKPEDDMINEDIVLEYRKGDADVDLERGTTYKAPDEYTEGKEVTQRVYKDEYNEPDFYEGEGIEEIKEEIIKDTTEKKIKRAGGGVAYMLGE